MFTVFGRVAPSPTAKLNLLMDVALVLACVPVAALLSGETGFGVVQLSFAVSLVAVWIVTAIALRHYDAAAGRDGAEDVAMTAVLVAALATVLLIIRLANGGVDLPTPFHFAATLLPTLVVYRLAVARPLAAGDAPTSDVLIVGTGALAQVTGEDIAASRPRRTVIGYLSLPGEDGRNLGEKVIGTSDQLQQCLESIPVSEIYIAGDATRQGEAMQAVIRVAETLGVPFALPAYAFRLDRARPKDLRSIGDGYLHYLTVDAKPRQMVLKRVLDIVASGLALWILLPLILTVAALIKLTSRGPVFFRQERVGLHGRKFHMLKFRSMVQDAEALKGQLEAQNEMSGPVFKIRNDPRITSIGRFIRKYSIDELPQLVNVLRGDMTIVGPRPPLPKEVAKYQPWQWRRLSVRPGLTCVWQVSGRNQISFEDWMYLDLQYIDHWSFTEDLRLIFKTVPVVLTGRGAS